MPIYARSKKLNRRIQEEQTAQSSQLVTSTYSKAQVNRNSKQQQNNKKQQETRTRGISNYLSFGVHGKAGCKFELRPLTCRRNVQKMRCRRFR